MSGPVLGQRRRFMKLIGLASAGITVNFTASCSLIPPIPKNPIPEAKDALGWISLTPDGRWQLYSPRMEMGQNILGSLQHVAAIELDVPAENIDILIPSTLQIGRVKGTAGSDSIREASLPLAQACYTLRSAVLSRAAKRLGSVASQMHFDGRDAVTPSGARIALRILGGEPLTLQAAEIAPSQLRFMRESTRPRPRFAQLTQIVTGQALYAGDVRLPDMLYAVVLRPEWSDQALAATPLLDWDESAVRSIANFHSIVHDPRLIGPALVSTRMGALLQMRAIAKPRWARPPVPVSDVMQQIDVDEAIARNSFTKTSGNVAEGAWTVDMRLDVPMAAHAAIEPRCAVAQPTESGGIKLWCGTQSPFFISDVLQRSLSLSVDMIEVQGMRIGGGFGGRTLASVELEAAVIARRIVKPVKVQWSREDEFVATPHRHPTSQRMQVRLATDGQISDWRHSVSSSNVLFTNAVVPPWMNTFTNIIGDKGTARGHVPLYKFLRQRLDLQLTRLPVFTGPWRGLGAGPNVLAIEMAIDAAARAAQADPFDFRLQHLRGAVNEDAGDPQRLVICLERLRTLIKKQPASVGRSTVTTTKMIPNNWRWFDAMGIASGCYKAMSYSATAAQVAIAITADKKLAAIELRELWCVHDCGHIIDADMVRAQVEGNLVWCIGMTMFEELGVNEHGIAQRSFTQYRVPRIVDVPQLNIDLIQSSAPPTGAGETAMVSGAGAIANALCRAFALAAMPMPTRMPVRLDT